MIYDPYSKTVVNTDSQFEPTYPLADGDYLVRIYKGRAIYVAPPDPVTIPVADNVPEISSDVSTVAGLRGKVNDILDALQDAGLMEPDPEPEPAPDAEEGT